MLPLPFQPRAFGKRKVLISAKRARVADGPLAKTGFHLNGSAPHILPTTPMDG
jgi:hypothetical protein